jgi:hypothetical protein
MTLEGERLEGTLAEWVSVAIWYCGDHDLNEPSPPLNLSEVVDLVRDYYAEFDDDDDDAVDPDEVEAVLRQLHALGEVTLGDAAGRWSLVPYDCSIFRRD